MQSIQVQVNGEERRLQAGKSLRDLLQDLSLPSAAVAVELNGEIILTRIWGQTILQPGDKIEIVQFLGGG